MSSPPSAPDFFDRRPVLVLAILAAAFYWKLTLSQQFTFLETPDLAFQVLPWFQLQARAWHHGVFPLWDPFQWCGQPLLGEMQPGAAFPLNWLLFLAPLKNGFINIVWVHRHYVLMHWLAALFMFALCRQLGSSRFASIVAGAAFSFGGYLSTTAWPQMVNGALWIPLIFLFLHRMVKTGSGLPAAANAALCGAAIGFSLLSGHHQAPMFSILAFCGVFLYYLFSLRGTVGRRRLVSLFAVIAAFAFLTGALQLLPAWEYGARAYRWVGTAQPVRMQDTVPYLAQYNYGIFPLSLLGTIFPKAHLTNDPFLGFVCLSFAFFAVAAGWDLARVRIYSAVALGAVTYAAGHYSLFHGLVYALTPFIDKARSPGHAIFVFQFAAATLTAQGIDLYFGPQQPEWGKWRSRIVKALIGAGLLSWALLFWLYLNLKFETNPGDHVILSSLVAFVLAAILYGLHQGHLSPRAVRVSVVLLLLFELSITSYFTISHRDDPKRALYLKELGAHPGIIGFLKGQQRPFRFEAPQADFPANLGDWEGLESTRGYLASVSADLYDFTGWDWNRSALLLNTVYMVARQPSRPQQTEVYAEASGWKVFRNEDALPRAWIVHSIRTVSDRQEAAALLRSTDFDPRREAVLLPTPETPHVETCPGDSSVTITEKGLHRLSARVTLPCAGLVVFAEPGFPGWQARVDGRAARLYAPFGALQAVAAPGGAHRVELVYRPYSVFIGAALSVLGVLGCCILVWFAKGRSNTAPAAR
jgi:hypothetical protein